MASTSMNGSRMEEEEEDLYGLFNVQRSASPEDINRAFKRLSRMYHPDRHTEPALKEKAERLFDKLRKAYDVLSDPERRSIYDTVGQRGLEITGWELAEVGRSPDEIRVQYERLRQLREEQERRENLNPSGSLILQLNATDLFLPRLGHCFTDPDKDPPYVDVVSVEMGQALEAPVTSSDRLSFGGGLKAKNGVGSAAFSANWKRLVSPVMWADFGVSLSDTPGSVLKIQRTFSKHMTGSLSVQTMLAHGRPMVGLVGELTRQLDRRWVGTLTGKLGLEQQLITSLAYDDGRKRRAVAAVVVGQPLSYLALTLYHRFPRQEAHLKVLTKLGPTIGAVTEVGWEGRLSEYNRGGAAFRLNWTRGVLLLKLKFQRGSQVYQANVVVCDNAEQLPEAWLWGVAAPLVALGLGRVLAEPLLRRLRSSGASASETRRRAAALEERRLEAASAAALMEAGAERSRAAEAAKGGLVILSAVYGRPLSAELLEGLSLEDVEALGRADVRVPLQAQVVDSKLLLYEAAKSSLPGFYDPCPGEDKSLVVTYRFRNKEHRVSVHDHQPLLLPKKSHQVS